MSIVSVTQILEWPFHTKDHSCRYVKAENRNGYKFTTFIGKELCRGCILDAAALEFVKANWIDEPCGECGEGLLRYGEECQECCDHEYDPDEGMMCINCNKEYSY